MDRVLCGANAQSMKYYFNSEEFGKLPKTIQDELKVMCVSYCADAGGVIMLSFDDSSSLHFQTISPTDEIGSELLIKRMQTEHEELFRQLEQFAREFGSRK